MTLRCPLRSGCLFSLSRHKKKKESVHEDLSLLINISFPKLHCRWSLSLTLVTVSLVSTSKESTETSRQTWNVCFQVGIIQKKCHKIKCKSCPKGERVRARGQKTIWLHSPLVLTDHKFTLPTNTLAKEWHIKGAVCTKQKIHPSTIKYHK